MGHFAVILCTNRGLKIFFSDCGGPTSYGPTISSRCNMGYSSHLCWLPSQKTLCCNSYDCPAGGPRVCNRSWNEKCERPVCIGRIQLRRVFQPLCCSYAACFLSIAGLVPSAPFFVTWGTDNAAPDTVRAVTSSIIPGRCSPSLTVPSLLNVR